jgi:hypothetical protein
VEISIFFSKAINFIAHTGKGGTHLEQAYTMTSNNQRFYDLDVVCEK